MIAQLPILADRKDEVKRLKKELENAHVNRSVSKDEAKVVNTIPFCDIEQCEQKTMCRCWKSSKVRSNW